MNKSVILTTLFFGILVCASQAENTNGNANHLGDQAQEKQDKEDRSQSEEKDMNATENSPWDPRALGDQSKKDHSDPQTVE